MRLLSLLGLLLGSLNFIVDDIITLDRLGILPKGIVTPSHWRTAGVAWFGTTLCALILNRWQMPALSESPETSFQLHLAHIA